MDAFCDPLEKLFSESFVATKMQTTQCLRFSKQGAKIFDRRGVQTSHCQIQMVQVNVILDKFFETRHDLEVEVT